MNFNLTYTRSLASDPEINTSLENLNCCGYSKGRQVKFEEYTKSVVNENIKALTEEFVKYMQSNEEEEEW
ncbi:MAG: hypothetical protein GQ564_12970 [Bacteroidales bacterium]|nr:hypothetical protein [Bacteroidales bacterium]